MQDKNDPMVQNWRVQAITETPVLHFQFLGLNSLSSPPIAYFSEIKSCRVVITHRPFFSRPWDIATGDYAYTIKCCLALLNTETFQRTVRAVVGRLGEFSAVPRSVLRHAVVGGIEIAISGLVAISISPPAGTCATVTPLPFLVCWGGS